MVVAKKITHFTIQIRSKNLTHFTKLNSLYIEKNMFPQQSFLTLKVLSHFTSFPANMFLVGVRKKICTTPFLEAQELHSPSTLKGNVCIFLYISVRKSLFQRRRKLLSGKFPQGGSLIGSRKMFYNFSF